MVKEMGVECNLCSASQEYLVLKEVGVSNGKGDMHFYKRVQGVVKFRDNAKHSE